jgi:hypothetical protein
MFYFDTFLSTYKHSLLLTFDNTVFVSLNKGVSNGNPEKTTVKRKV